MSVQRRSMYKIRRKQVTKKGRYPVRSAIYNVPRGISSTTKHYGVPGVFTTRLRYVDNYSSTLSGATPTRYSFRLNSLFDPDYTGGGHQPMYRDQLIALYTNYTVLGSIAKFYFNQIADDGGATDYGPILCGVLKDEDGSVSSTVTDLQENNTSVFTYLTRDNGGSKTLTCTYSPRADLGRDASDDTVGASAGNNPSQVSFANVYLANLGNTALNPTISWTVEIEFLVKMTRQNNAVGS